MKLLPWTSQSPDLNLWAELKRRVNKRGSVILDDLERFCLGMVSDLYSTTLLDVTGKRLHACFIGKGRLYKVKNSGVTIIVGTHGFVKNNEGFSYCFSVRLS